LKESLMRMGVGIVGGTFHANGEKREGSTVRDDSEEAMQMFWSTSRIGAA